MRFSSILLASTAVFVSGAAQAQVISLDPVVISSAPDAPSDTSAAAPGTDTSAGSATAGGTAVADGGDANGAGEGSRGGTGFPEGTGNSTTVTQAELERTNPQTLREVFLADPAINVGSSIPMSQKIYVQGIEEPNLAVTIDGTRQNNKVFHHSATTLIDPDLLKAVRVDPGVAPADAGPGALGGSIAFETKDVGDLLAPGQMFGGLISGEYVTNGNIFSTNGALYGRHNGFEALIYGKWADGGDRTDGNGDEIIGSETKLLSGLGKLAYEADSGDRFEAAFEIVNDDAARPYRANIGRITGGRPVPDTRNYHLQRQNYTLTYTDTSPTALWDPKIQLGYSRTWIENPEDEQYTEGLTDSFNGRAQNTLSGEYGTLTLGTDFYVDRARLNYDYLLDRAFDEGGTEHAQNVGFYSQARLNWTPRFRTFFGARVDVQHFEGVDGSDQTNVGPSLNLTTEVDVTSFLTAYVGGAHVWAGIPLAENYIIDQNWTYDSPSEVTTSDNLVAGLRAHYQGFSAGAKVFQTRIYNARLPEYGGDAFATRDLDTRGVELTAGYTNYGFNGTVGYAYIDSDIDGEPADSDFGRYLTVPLGHIVKASASYTYAPWGLTIGADTEIAFENDDVFDPYSGTGDTASSIPGYEVVNAFAELTPVRFPNLTLRAEANNVFDEAYASRATFGQEYTGQGVTPLYEPGRSFLFKATARF
ncbi:TonB-dependent receptor plug domain-containing protein [Acuticoccus yangtzensis]|uniref:TonB-dependent receptor plug domain-containing protein n=1 Tax=Acuticoccus yangtzensis TaxID=1443441 RepID=UPI00094995F0|nr:TonB-dependent receptor plug domain-containing protein [Acuticoccus yangtzensis]